jgi:spermidine/putrescine transport system permease protein
MAAGKGGVKAVGEGLFPRKKSTPWLLLAPGLLWLFVFFVIPLIELGRASLKGGFSNFSKVFSDNGTTIVRTFVYAFIATVVALALGYPLAYFIAIKAKRFKTLLLASVVLPFFVTYLIRTLAWKSLLSLGSEPLVPAPVAVIGALVYNFLPFMILPIYVSLDKIDRRLLEAAPDLYATTGRTFTKVILPLSLPGVFAGSLLTFIPSCGDFINAELLGGVNQRMIGNVVSETFFDPNFRGRTSALSFVLMLLILGGVLLYARILGTEDLA